MFATYSMPKVNRTWISAVSVVCERIDFGTIQEWAMPAEFECALTLKKLTFNPIRIEGWSSFYWERHCSEPSPPSSMVSRLEILSCLMRL